MINIKSLLKILFVLTITFILGLSFYYKYKNDEQKKSISKIKTTVKISLKECSMTKPVIISISNNSNKTIKRSYFSLGLYKKGFSSNLANYTYSDVNTDKIINPFEKYSFCVRLPYDYSVTNINALFSKFLIKEEEIRDYVLEKKSYLIGDIKNNNPDEEDDNIFQALSEMIGIPKRIIYPIELEDENQSIQKNNKIETMKMYITIDERRFIFYEN